MIYSVKNLCVVCGIQIDKSNDSKEHIIPAAIGGRKTVSGFVCRGCNNSTGRTWDASLCKELSPLTAYLRVKRQTKKSSKHIFETTDNKKVALHSDGKMYEVKPRVDIEKKGEHLAISLSMRNKKELKRKLNELAKKYTKLDPDSAMKNYKENRKHLDGDLKFDLRFGNGDTGRSIIKSVLALIHANDISVFECKLALEYLTGSGQPCFGYYHTNDLIKERGKGVPVNCVSVKGIGSKKRVLAYVEYYGIHKVVCCVSDTYTGKDFHATYAFDASSGDKLAIEVDLNLSDDEIVRAYTYERTSQEMLVNACIPVLDAAYERACNERGLQKGLRHYG